MAKNPLRDGNTPKNTPGLATVTRKKVLGREEELAIISGGWLHKLSPSDFEQARRELTGEPDMAPQEAPVESLPESER
jgi:hypothetical protein